MDEREPVKGVYIVVRQADYEDCDLPEECFIHYDTALRKLHELAKQMRLKVRKGNYIKISGGSIEIHPVKIADA